MYYWTSSIIQDILQSLHAGFGYTTIHGIFGNFFCDSVLLLLLLLFCVLLLAGHSRRPTRIFLLAVDDLARLKTPPGK
jgi:hypothetical protein